MSKENLMSKEELKKIDDRIKEAHYIHGDVYMIRNEQAKDVKTLLAEVDKLMAVIDAQAEEIESYKEMSGEMVIDSKALFNGNGTLSIDGKAVGEIIDINMDMGVEGEGLLINPDNMVPPPDENNSYGSISDEKKMEDVDKSEEEMRGSGLRISP